MREPVIFLVEDIEDNIPIPVITKNFSKLRNPRGYLEEITKMLSSQPPTHIEFIKVKDFISSVNLSTFPYHRKIFYFISSFHTLSTFTIYHFLLIDTEVIDFLTKYKISIIIDGSIEESQMRDASHQIFDSQMNTIPGKTENWRGILDLPIYLVNGGNKKTHRLSSRLPNIHYRHFHGSFFHCTYPGTKIYNEALEHRDKLFSHIDSKIITEDTLVWQAFCREPRMSRILFQLTAEDKGLTKFGKYSRLMPCGTYYEHHHKSCELSFFGLNLRQEDIDELNSIKILPSDPPSTNENEVKKLGLFKSNSLIHVILETCSLHNKNDILFQPTQLTEKTSTTILSGMPFIPLGGQFSTPLELLGFKSYFKLNWPTNENYLDSVDYVCNLLLEISRLPISEKQELYSTWKETIKYNFDNFFNINIQEMYLTFLNLENTSINVS